MRGCGICGLTWEQQKKGGGLDVSHMTQLGVYSKEQGTI